MPETFDIFSGFPYSDPHWIESVVGFDRANDRMKSIAQKQPGVYFIICLPSPQILNLLDTRGAAVQAAAPKKIGMKHSKARARRAGGGR